MFIDLDRDDIKKGLVSEAMLLVDVREPHEFVSGHIPGSISMPLSRFDPAALPVNDGRQIVFSCAAGIRSMQALMLARQAGLAVEAHYRGGFKDWAYSGEKVETGE